MGQTLSAVLDEARRQGFVGRVEELRCFDAALTGSGPARVLFVQGPGGIGKSTLLDELRRRAVQAGRPPLSLHGRDLGGSIEQVAAAAAALPAGPDPVLLVDGYELLSGWTGGSASTWCRRCRRTRWSCCTGRARRGRRRAAIERVPLDRRGRRSGSGRVAGRQRLRLLRPALPGRAAGGVDSMLSHNESVSLLTLPGDSGTWGVGITTSSRDHALRALRHRPCWEAAMRCYPATAGWIDAEPITGVSVMAGIEDRQRQLVVDSVPVVTGLVAVGDAAASTNPSLGRGASIGALHARLLRDVVAKEGTDDPDALVLRFAAETAVTVAPYVDSTLSFDRHRLAEIEADIAGVPYEPADPAGAMTRALGAGGREDPPVARALAAIASALALPAELLSDAAVRGRVAGFPGRTHYAPGADRTELLAAVRGAERSR